MAASAFDLTRNFHGCSALLLSIAPHFYASSLGKFDNKNPRSYTKDTLADQRIDNATKDLIVRAEGAQQNGFENIGLFAAVVVAGNMAKLDNWTLNALTGGCLVSRAVYNLLYLNSNTDAKANARSVSFLAGVGLIWTLFIKSGNVLRGQL